MLFEVITHPEAADELREALQWYGRTSARAPDRLLAEYAAHVAKICHSPESIRFVYREFRRLNLDRFPYAIIYRIREHEIFIIAVMHERRPPDYWKRRIDDDDRLCPNLD